MRGRSYTPSPPRGHGRRGRSPSPRGRYASRDIDLPTSLLVRNLRHDCRPEDLRRPFGHFGPLKDVYLPRDYHSGEPRGFGFVQFADPNDAAEAKYHLDGQVLLGREMTVVFAEENRKKPTDMRGRERGSRRHDRRRSPPPRYSRSPPRRHARSRSRSRDYSASPKQRHYSRSVSPQDRRPSREKSGPKYSRDRSYSPSPRPLEGSRSRSQSPARHQSPVKDVSRSLSRSPDPEIHPKKPNGDRSPSQ